MLVIDRQTPPVGFLYRPAGHDSMPSQQISFLIKVLSGEEQGAEVSAEMEVVLQPNELHAIARTVVTLAAAPACARLIVVRSPGDARPSNVRGESRMALV